jgi:hypothetical protein
MPRDQRGRQTTIGLGTNDQVQAAYPVAAMLGSRTEINWLATARATPILPESTISVVAKD